MSDASACNDFLELIPKILYLSKIHMRGKNDFSNLLYHRHCWLSKTFYRTQISSTDLEKYQFFAAMTKMWHKCHVTCLLKCYFDATVPSPLTTVVNFMKRDDSQYKPGLERLDINCCWPFSFVK